MATAKRMVAANLPARVSDLVERCRVLVKGMTKNTYFPSPSPTLAVFTKDIDALHEADVKAKLSISVIPIRDAALKIVVSDVRRLVNYVQLIANANPHNAEVIINSSGFHIRRVIPGVNKREYKVESLETGKVILTASPNNIRSPYIWEVSINGTDWSFLLVSRITSTKCETLTPGQLYYFRYLIISKDNKTSTVSHVVSCMVK